VIRPFIYPAIIAFALAGCVIDRGKCLDERMEFILVPQVITLEPIVTMQKVQPVVTCYKWEYPEGRKQ